MQAHAGRRGWRYEQLKKNLRNRGDPCCRCGKPIDYMAPWPHPLSFSVDHFPFPMSTHPQLAEDPDNLAAAHLRCNQSAGNGESRYKPRRKLPDTGQHSRQW